MLPFRSGCSRTTGAFAAIFAAGILFNPAGHAEGQGSPKPAKDKPKKGAISPAGIPLPIGQEAKGLVLPDYDLQGRLQARFEAASAKRIDEERIQFTGLKVTTFSVETNTPDLTIDMPRSTLEITSRVVSSQARTTVSRADFHIAGDAMRFDTVARRGRLVGNVKMVITNSSQLTGKAGE